MIKELLPLNLNLVLLYWNNKKKSLRRVKVHPSKIITWGNINVFETREPKNEEVL